MVSRNLMYLVMPVAKTKNASAFSAGRKFEAKASVKLTVSFVCSSVIRGRVAQENPPISVSMEVVTGGKHFS